MSFIPVCFACKKEIRLYGPEKHLIHATEFVGGGSLESRVTNDNRKYSVHICDDCMKQLLENKDLRVLVFTEITAETKRKYEL